MTVWITFIAVLKRQFLWGELGDLSRLRDPHERKWCKKLCGDYVLTPEELVRVRALFDLPLWQQAKRG